MVSAIYYATDNEEKVINLSINKPRFPARMIIVGAIKYATLKDVLIINAAGNEGNSDQEKHGFPSRNYQDGEQAKG